MNIKTKFTYFAFALSLTTTVAFGQTALSTLATPTAISLTFSSTALTYTPPTAPTGITGDLAIIEQAAGTGTGTGSVTGSDAFIQQENTLSSPNIAFISQVGDGNKAYIQQSNEGNVALISQISDGNLAFIDQKLSTTGMAGITQESTLPSAAYITQSGSTHSALIIQK